MSAVKLTISGDEYENSFSRRVRIKKSTVHLVYFLPCDVTWYSKNLIRYLKKMHNTEFTPSCICVDGSEEIYFCQKVNESRYGL